MIDAAGLADSMTRKSGTRLNHARTDMPSSRAKEGKERAKRNAEQTVQRKAQGFMYRSSHVSFSWLTLIFDLFNPLNT